MTRIEIVMNFDTREMAERASKELKPIYERYRGFTGHYFLMPDMTEQEIRDRENGYPKT